MPPLKEYIYLYITKPSVSITVYAYDDSRANKLLEDIVKDAEQFQLIKN